MEMVSKGKILLIAVIVVALASSLVVTLLETSVLHYAGETSEAMFNLLQGFIRFILTGLLFLFVYIGHRWARITALILSGAGGFFAFIFAFELHMLNMLSMLIAIPQFFCFIVLLSKPVRAYQHYAKNGNLDSFK